MKKYHKKKRNSALIYEFLIRHISKCLVEGKKDEAKKAIDISKKYFSEGKVLRTELNLFSTVMKTSVKTRESAQKIIDEVCRVSTKMNTRVLDEQKSKLIKDINYTFNQESFYDYKIPNYTIYASMQVLLNESRNKKKFLNIVDKVKLEESISDYLTRDIQPQSSESPLKLNPNYNNTVYTFLIQKFHKKYEGKLNEAQKKVLTQYAAYLISNKKEPLIEVIVREAKKVKKSLSYVQDESIKKDSDLMKKIDECKSKFAKFTLKELNEQTILEFLQYMRLIEELNS